MSRGYSPRTYGVFGELIKARIDEGWLQVLPVARIG
jgi:hypothetical protein